MPFDLYRALRLFLPPLALFLETAGLFAAGFTGPASVGISLSATPSETAQSPEKENKPDPSALKKKDKKPEKSNWTFKTKLAAYVTQTVVQNSEFSHESNITGKSNSWAYSLSLYHEGKYDVKWYSWEQKLDLAFGQSETSARDSAGKTVTINDEIDDKLNMELIQGFKKALPSPQEVYVSERFESAFTGADPDDPNPDDTDLFHPQILKLSTGYRLIPIKNLDLRFGLRGMNYLDDATKDWDFGLEFILEYKYKKNDVSFNSRFESFDGFEDAGYVTLKLDNKLNLQVTKIISMEITWLLYYETNPKDYPPGDEEYYNTLSWKQSYKLGLLVAF